MSRGKRGSAAETKKVSSPVRPARRTPLKRHKGVQRTKTGGGRDRLVEKYQGFVHLIVARLIRTMSFPKALRDEFISAGYLGLVEAASRFDATRGHDFRAFAFLRIRGAIIDHIRSSCELSGSSWRAFKALDAVHELRTEMIEQEHSGAAQSREGAARSLEFLSKSLIAYRLTSVKNGVVSLGAEASEDPEKRFEKRESAEKIRQIVATLPEKERTIIEQYYFHDRKFSDIATQSAGLSKSWVSRLHDRALATLKERMETEVPELLDE